jgi:hypothetical protein
MGELAYNLESFNPAFTAVLLKVQSTIGHSDYVARDLALKNLIQPLAGEYGMHNGQEQGVHLPYAVLRCPWSQQADYIARFSSCVLMPACCVR